MLTEEQLRRRLELAGAKVPSMHRRKQDHDYTVRRMYMVTMATERRLPLFGVVKGDPHVPFGEPGYNDKILLRAGQLDTWKRYLADNPRRLLVKREHKEFFRVQRGIQWKGRTFSTLGNLFLLRHPLLTQIQCSRSLTAEEIEKRKAEALAACRTRGQCLSLNDIAAWLCQ